VIWLLASARRPSTITTYHVGMNSLVSFLEEHGLLIAPSTYTRTLPEITPALFVHFLAWLFRAMYSSNTIRSYLTAVRSWHKTNGKVDPARGAALTRTNGVNTPFLPYADALMAVKRHSAPPKAKYAVTSDQLSAIVSLCTTTVDEHRQAANLAAATTLAWFGLLRVSEYTVPDAATFDATRHATRADVTFAPTTGTDTPLFFDINIKNSKNSLLRDPGFVARIYQSGTTTCAVMAMWTLYQTYPLPPTSPLFDFRAERDHTLSVANAPRRAHFVKLVSQVLRATGYDDKGISSHSFRRGGATALARAGATEAMIQHAGRWRSQCWQGYIVADLTFATDLPRMMMAAPPVSGMHWTTATPH